MSDYTDDPVYLQSRKEAILVLIVWAISFVWTVSYCYWNGYTAHSDVEGSITAYLPDMSSLNRNPESLKTPYGLGIPDWCFWGVAVPWVVCILVSTWFSFGYMTDIEEEEQDATVEAGN